MKKNKRLIVVILTLLPLLIAAIIFLLLTWVEEEHRAQTQQDFLHAMHMQHGSANTIKDPVAAAQLYTDIIRHGHTGAMVNLGQMYLKGEGVPDDTSRGAELIARAADQMALPGIVGLAELYLHGKGVEANPVISHSLLQLASAMILASPQSMTTYPGINDMVFSLQQQTAASMDYLQRMEARKLGNAMYASKQVTTTIATYRNTR